MSWAEDMMGGLPPPVSQIRVSPRPPTREEPSLAPGVPKVAEGKADDVPAIGYGANIVYLNRAMSGLVVETKGKAKMNLPCGDCIEEIAAQIAG